MEEVSFFKTLDPLYQSRHKFTKCVTCTFINLLATSSSYTETTFLNECRFYTVVVNLTTVKEYLLWIIYVQLSNHAQNTLRISGILNQRVLCIWKKLNGYYAILHLWNVIYLNDNERRITQNKSLNIGQGRRFGLKEA